MATIKKVYQVEKNSEDIRRTILINTIKMLTERNLLKHVDIEKNIKSILSKTSDDMTYEVDNLNHNNIGIAIKITPHKITAINRSYGISEFLVAYKNHHKIIVVKDISKKARQYILNNYANTEIFLEEELLINIVDLDIVPKHEILTEDETANFYAEFNCKKKNMPKILSTDPVARYYNMKVGNICRILRPSDKCGISVCYRLVIKGSFK